MMTMTVVSNVVVGQPRGNVATTGSGCGCPLADSALACLVTMLLLLIIKYNLI
jgi:hypothetical protein